MHIYFKLFGTGVLQLIILTTINGIKADEMIQEGMVVDSLSGKPVPFVHILNESSRRGYITDSLGKFSIRTELGDTLAFISLGYLGKVVIVDTLLPVIKLMPRTYDIEEVSIEDYRSYKQFQNDFLNLEVENEEEIQGLPKGKPIDIPVLLDTNYLANDAFMIFHPVSYLYYKFSKEERSKRKAFYLKRQEGEQLVIEKKYNRDIVHHITGLEGEELTNFIGFCNFSHKYLFESTELEIVIRIYEKFEEYKSGEKSNE